MKDEWQLTCSYQSPDFRNHSINTSLPPPSHVTARNEQCMRTACVVIACYIPAQGVLSQKTTESVWGEGYMLTLLSVIPLALLRVTFHFMFTIIMYTLIIYGCIYTEKNCNLKMVTSKLTGFIQVKILMNHNAIWTELTDKYINYTQKHFRFRLNQVEITLEGNNCRLPIVTVYQSKVKKIFLSYVPYVHQGCIYLINNRVMLLLFIYLFIYLTVF